MLKLHRVTGIKWIPFKLWRNWGYLEDFTQGVPHKPIASRWGDTKTPIFLTGVIKAGAGIWTFGQFDSVKNLISIYFRGSLKNPVRVVSPPLDLTGGVSPS